MSHILIRVGIGIAVAAGAALFAWLQTRNQRNQNTFSWNAPPTGPYPSGCQCPICLGEISDLRVFRTPCGHVLHWECAKLLFTQPTNKCPLCREMINQSYLRQQGMILRN